MRKSKGKINTKEILADIRNGMDESRLMEKHQLSPQNLQNILRQLSRAGLLEQVPVKGRIPEDHAWVPVEKKARDVPRDSDEQKRRLRRLRQAQRAQEENERILEIVESTLHWWLFGLGVVTFLTGITLYLMWPYIETLWSGDLALDRVLGHRGSAELSYNFWHGISTRWAPVMALVGGSLVVAGLIKRWLNKRKIERLLVRQRRGLVFESSSEEE